MRSGGHGMAGTGGPQLPVFLAHHVQLLVVNHFTPHFILRLSAVVWVLCSTILNPSFFLANISVEEF